MTSLVHNDGMVAILTWGGWSVAVLIGVIRVVRRRGLSITLIDSYDETDALHRLILTATIVIRESRNPIRSQPACNEKEREV